MSALTNSERRARGRPASPQRQAAASWINGYGQFTMGAMARCLGMSTRDANNTIARLRGAGLVQLAGVTRSAEAKRPVAVYAPVQSAAGAEPPAAVDLTRVWA